MNYEMESKNKWNKKEGMTYRNTGGKIGCKTGFPGAGNTRNADKVEVGFGRAFRRKLLEIVDEFIEYGLHVDLDR
jgi:hypothetical protein